MEGGQGTSWRYGELVLKPLDMPVEALAWQAEHLPRLTDHEFRIVPPVAAGNGALTIGGWTAWRYAEGRHEPGRWRDIIAAGNKFHEALRDADRPSFTRGRDDRWAVADRIAWGEEPLGPATRSPLSNRLLAAMRPIEARDQEARDQLVHCDLTGNVLFHRDLPPAIIDLSLYWRPTAYASAVVVTDAITFEGAGDDLAETHDGQCLLRAIAFRLLTDRLAGIEADEADAPYLRIARLALAMT